VTQADETKIAANASVQATRDREWLRVQVAMMLAEAKQVAAAQDASHEHDAAATGSRRTWPTGEVPRERSSETVLP
jgi:uncharacterized protein YhjY with autotransporter beta-barrel domain